MEKTLIEGEKVSAIIYLLTFTLGGLTYGLIEILYRGHTHWSMCITGGACVLSFLILSKFLFSLPLLLSALVGSIIILIYEFAVGIIVNKVFDLGVWDYSNLFGNILGQICPQFFFAWYCLCLLFFALIKFLSTL